MNIKSLVIAMSISSVSLSAADIPNNPNDESSSLVNFIKESPNSFSDITVLIQDYSVGKKSPRDINTFVKSLQAEIYGLVDNGQIEKAKVRFDSVTALLYPLYESMNDEERWSSGEETLGLMAQYIDDHDQSTHIYRTLINTTLVEQ